MPVLVVDDDPIAGEITCAILEDAGYQTFQVEDGVAALEYLDEHPDARVVVSDLHMPLLSGLDLLGEMRTRGLLMPFILLSGTLPGEAAWAGAGAARGLIKDDTLEETLPATVAGMVR